MQLHKIRFTEFLHTNSSQCMMPPFFFFYQLFILTLTVCFYHDYLMLANYDARRQELSMTWWFNL